MIRIFPVALLLCTTIVSAFEPSFERAPTNYSDTRPVTPITKIADRLAKGEPLLNGKTGREVLLQVLELLEIPYESQMLVYSKTSAQNSRISPRTPRAIYFSDNAYIGWVQNGNIETMTFDERLGPVFHMIHISNHEPLKAPEITRERSCLNCHAGSATRDFPGGLVRSVFPSEDGQPIFHAGTFRTTDRSPVAERWGGWYVTGSSGKQTHFGNIVATETEDREVTITKLDSPMPFDATRYPAKNSSDIVALMIFEHQIAAQNVIAQANIVTRQTLHRHLEMRKAFGESPDAPLSETNQHILEGQADKVIAALLFKEEFEMTNDGVDGSIDFQKAFQKNARKSTEHRSLKDLRLLERLFKYRCSYVIYSDPFKHLPDEIKSIVIKRLHDILTNAPSWPDYSYLTSSERKRILLILEETFPGWPEEPQG